MIDPGRFGWPFFGLQVASACAIKINVFVHLQNEPEKSSIAVLSLRLTGVTLDANVIPVSYLCSDGYAKIARQCIVMTPDRI